MIDYLNIEREIDNLIVCGLNSAYILKIIQMPLKRRSLLLSRTKEIDTFQDLPEDEYVKIALNINENLTLH